MMYNYASLYGIYYFHQVIGTDLVCRLKWTIRKSFELFLVGCLGSEVEYAVIPTELDESADVHGDDLSDAAKQCRFRALVVSFLLALGDFKMPCELQVLPYVFS